MNLHFLDEGKGPPILLLHAFPLNSTMWEPQVTALKNNYRVIAPDTRGFGSTPVADTWTLEQAADDLDQLLDGLGITACTVAGLSMGGYIAFPFYAKFPNRVSRLILADTRARADNEAEKRGRTEMIAALQQSGASILPDRMLPRLLKPNAAAPVVKQVRGIMATASAMGAIFALMAMRDRPDMSTVIHRITRPTLVIAGDHDAVTRIDECRGMAESIRDGKFVPIPDAGHLSNLENPAAFNRALLDFVG